MPFEHDSVINIVNEARRHSTEKPWIEFKVNNSNPQEIGEYISALSNTAALFSQNYGFVIWGVNDVTHEIDGTKFIPEKAKKGNQSLELWLSTLIEPQVQFYFHTVDIDGRSVVLLEIAAAFSSPIKFQGIEYIRIGSNKKKLKDFPDTERQLWSIFSREVFEQIVAVENASVDTVLRMLDYREYYERLKEPLPSKDDSIIERFIEEKMIARNEAGSYNILNLGAILFAHRLSDFPTLERKAIRVISYSGEGKASSSSRETILNKGYANGFEDLISFIFGMVPDNEDFSSPLRKDIPVYPEEAVRELMGNLMIHQDFHMRGTGPMVELFKSRMEVANPGTPLIEKDRFVDHPPVSRNEVMAGLLRRVGIGEERGYEFDRIIEETEAFKLPSPEIMVYDTHTRVTLFAYKPYAKLNKRERRLACYYHACIKWVLHENMTNSSLRERFEVDDKNISMISRLLADSCKAGLIKISEAKSSGNNRVYIPYWA